ncbi:MAG TPA: hypothetical protein PLA90_14085, partial [Candidatus Sumerlaeota bacterium]|nr:hypothetical protein [Candidatus Sumerlaeota bacterium]
MGHCPVVNEVFRRILVGILFFVLGTIGAQAAPVVSSFRINNGVALTANPAVTLPNVCAGATSATHSYLASESANFTSATWQPYAPVPLFVLSNSSGTKTVYFKVKDQANVESAVTSDTITLGGSGFPIAAWGNNSPRLPSPNEGFIAISAGLGLKSDGSVVTWGYDAYGRENVPQPNSGFVAVSSEAQCLGLKSDGSVVAWGYNGDGRCNVPSPNSGFVDVSAGSGCSLGLKADGSIVVWGDNSSALYSVPLPNSGFVALSTGGSAVGINYVSHGMGLKSDGSIVVWGNNQFGECAVPVPNSGFVAVSAGGRHSLGLKANGSIVAWGDNRDGQCNVPEPNLDFVAILAGTDHSLGLKADGTLVAWGSNQYGQCDISLPNNHFVAISNSTGVLALAAGGNLQVTLTPSQTASDGAQWRLTSETAEVWHNSGETVRGVGSRTVTFKEIYGWIKPADQPVELTSAGTTLVTGSYKPVDWTLSTSCTQGSFQVVPAGTIFPHQSTVTLTLQPDSGYWFDHWSGDVPEGYERVNPLVVTMDADKTILAHLVAGPTPPAPKISSLKINSGTFMTVNPAVTLPNVCVSEADGDPVQYLASESSSFAGALWKPYRCVPLFLLSQSHGMKTVYFKVKNSAGAESAVTSDTITLGGEGYSVVAWGSNAFGECDVPSPNRDFVAFAGGGHHSLGLKSDGTILPWGYNSRRFTIPSPDSGFVAVATAGISAERNLALRADGSVVSWGASYTVPSPNRNFVSIAMNDTRSLYLKSDGSLVEYGMGSLPEPNRDFVAIAAGDRHFLCLKSDGSIVALGGVSSNDSGQCNIPEPNRDFVAIAACGNISVGLKSDGSIVPWGSLSSVPSSNRDFIAIAAGWQHVLGLKADGSIVAWGNNFDGRCNVPSPNRGFVAVAGGGSHSLALVTEGSVQVALPPPEAVAAGARWRLANPDKGTWHDESEYDPTWVWKQSGDTETTRTGTYNLKFKTVYGWEKPETRSVDLTTTGTARVTAAYTRTLWTLETSCTHASIQVSPAGTSFPHETTVTLAVQPEPGYWFDRWVGDVPKGSERVNPLVLKMDADKEIQADIESPPAPPTDLTVAINNGLTTTINPAVTLANHCTGSTSGTLVSYMASESADFTSATWQPYRSVPLFILS